MNNWLIFDLVFYNCVGVHGDLDAYEDGGIHACERCQAYKMPPPPPSARPTCRKGKAGLLYNMALPNGCGFLSSL